MTSRRDGFAAARIDQHVGTTGRHVHRFPLRGTGLYQEDEINGRQAEDFELEARERAYERQRGEVGELLTIRPWAGAR